MVGRIIIKNVDSKKHELSKKFQVLVKKLVNNMYPTEPQRSLSFEMHNTLPEFANVIRTTINTRLKVLILDFDDIKVKTDDTFIIVYIQH